MPQAPPPTTSIDRLPGEPLPHARSRNLQKILRGAIVGFIAATAIALFTAPGLAVYLAPPVPILFLVLLIADRYERRTRAERIRRPGQRRPSRAEVRVGMRIAGIATAVKIGLALVVSAVIVAAALLGWKWIGVGAALMFFFMVLFGLPFWLAAIGETREDERERMTGSPPIPPRDPAEPPVSEPPRAKGVPGPHAKEGIERLR